MYVSKELAASGALPTGYADKPGAILIAAEMAARLDMPLMSVIAGCPIVNGRVGMEGKFALALMQTKLPYHSHRFEKVGQEGTDSFGLRFVLELFDGRVKVGPEVTIEMAKNFGWWGKPGSFWPKMTNRMLQYRAVSWFLKDTYPGLTMGLDFKDEILDMGEAQTIEVEQRREANQILTQAFEQPAKEEISETRTDQRLATLKDMKNAVALLGLENKEDISGFVASVLGREVGSAKDLTPEEIHEVIMAVNVHLNEEFS